MVLPTGASYRRRAMATVTAVSAERTHSMSKPNRDSIRLLAGLGVEGDAHLGQTVRHLSRIARDPTAPNLRQVHLIHAELHDALRERGFDVSAGQLGENLTTRGVDPLALPVGTLLHLGATAVVEVTGLRNPCRQLEGIQAGLMAAVLNGTRPADSCGWPGSWPSYERTGTCGPATRSRSNSPWGGIVGWNRSDGCVRG